MEHLIIDLTEKLKIRKTIEMQRINNLNAESDNVVLMVSSGKLIELEYVIKTLEEMIQYQNKIKNILK